MKMRGRHIRGNAWRVICASLLFFFHFAFLVSSVQAQPQFRNTTSFDTGDSIFHWSARIGARLFRDSVYDDTTTGSHVLSSCIFNEDLVGDSLIKSLRYNNQDTNTTISDTCNNYGLDALSYRFTIYDSTTAGLDRFTINNGSGLSRIAPGYQTSIRLGCMAYRRGGVPISGPYDDFVISEDEDAHTDGAQSLFYTMRITSENALLIINFAIVCRRYNHDAWDAGEFLVRIVKRDSTGEWANEPINDYLWYKVIAPYVNILSAPWVAGAEGGNYPCKYVYKPWAKTAVNLDEFMGEEIRVEFYSSNCIYGVDPLYAYIAGDYSAPVLESSGCPDPTSPFIDTVYAPEGLLGYEWFVSTEGPCTDLQDYARLDTMHFRRMSPFGNNPDEPYNTFNYYCPTIESFMYQGDTLKTQTFMCILHSALDPRKPFTSRLYINITNHRPVAKADYTTSCDRSVQLINRSVPPPGDSLDPSATYWVVFNDFYGRDTLTILYGDTVTCTFPEVRGYRVRLYTFTYPDSTGRACGATRDPVVQVRGPSRATIGLSSRALCVGTPLTAKAVLDSIDRAFLAAGNLSLRWSVNGTPIEETDLNYERQGDTLLLFPNLAEGMYAFELNTNNPTDCPTVQYDTAFVFENPSIVIDPANGLLCLGDTLTISAFRDDMYDTAAYFAWIADPTDPDLDAQQGQPVLKLAPDTATTYALLPSPLSFCQLDTLSVTVEVFPYPIPALTYHPTSVDLDHPTLKVTDLTPDATHNTWRFSDGEVQSGLSLTHLFSSVSTDSVGFTLYSCNVADCCADTSIRLPVTVVTLWVPNTFIPAAEENNRFSVITNQQLLDFKIHIYNRRGQLVYSTNDPHFEWDGTDLHGAPLPQGAYVYTLHYRLPSSETYYYPVTGTVTLLR